MIVGDDSCFCLLIGKGQNYYCKIWKRGLIYIGHLPPYSFDKASKTVGCSSPLNLCKIGLLTK